ncbi:hypothetical protein DOY81_003614 [Sarcophaga bullata]|nr:hypothetical protein DOY81_003614 [Sarcophaga bullata]
MDVSHELGALRFVVDSPLSSKVAMFNQQVDQHKQSQLLNPFSQTDGRASPKPSFSKDEYGKPLAGSLTEMRGQKANMHVLKEMLELCQIIDSEGYNVKDEPTMRVIPFGELFNIYNYISDKVVGILLRARKHKLVEFEGEMLFQRRDDDVPIFLIKPIQEIRQELNEKIESIKKSGSASPQATSVLLDKKAHGLNVPKGATPRSSVSRTPSPRGSKASTPVRDTAATKGNENNAPQETAQPKTETNEGNTQAVPEAAPPKIAVSEGNTQAVPETTPPKIDVSENNNTVAAAEKSESPVKLENSETPTAPAQTLETTSESPATAPAPAPQNEVKPDVNNNNDNLPTIVIEATAVYHGPAKTETADATAESNITAPSDNTETTAASA